MEISLKEGNDHGFIFLNTKGNPFDDHTFSKFFRAEMKKRLGEGIGLIRLRHRFL